MSHTDAPHGQPNLYLLINGSPQGPYSKDQIHAMLTNGTLTREVLFCEDGGHAWLQLGSEFPASSPVVSALPPAQPAPLLPPSRNDRKHRLNTDQAGQDQMRWWRVMLTAAALGCFFLPWLRCGDSGVLFQTGLDIIKPAISINNPPDGIVPPHDQIPLGGSVYCVAAVGLLVIGLCLSSFRRYQAGSPSGHSRWS